MMFEGEAVLERVVLEEEVVVDDHPPFLTMLEKRREGERKGWRWRWREEVALVDTDKELGNGTRKGMVAAQEVAWRR
ncbi:hypothetical protein E2562_008167 [Oryza meyeriana var. granulata]|uniref:Uncharacterized protein n=1 Tax=Oryza meyeriana var. granulata TaxID=110450 RepID=A0A6G1CEU9_9ORYZ|nr:hypothetical protein E2562_008167 [Oryza meyeriana var. granulata]